jgi:hypothetical protein
MKRRGTCFALLLLLLVAMMMSGCPNGDDETTIIGGDPAENDPPEAPHSPYPTHMSTDQSTHPVFIWECVDPEADPLTFTLYLTRESDYHQFDPIVTSSRTYTWTQDLEKGTEYSWYVEADDGSNDPVSSVVWTFFSGTTQNNPPLMPHTPDPPDYATDVQAEDVTLSWSCGDPDGDPLVYDVWLEVHNGSGDFIVENSPDAFYNIGALGKGVDFRWHVVAKDDQGGITTGIEWRFETEETNAPPVVPYNPIPADEETAAPLNQLLVWTCSDPDGDPLTYDVYFGPPLMIMLVSSGQSERTYRPSGMLKDTDYEWRIVAHDDEGAETEGPFWSFTTANEVFAELLLIRNITNSYGYVTRNDMIKARFDATYAPDAGIAPLQPEAVMCNAYPLRWLGYEKIYFYSDPQGDPIIWPGSTYNFDVTAGGGVDFGLEQEAQMPECEAYFTSPEENSSISLSAGFEVQWESSCPGTGAVDIYVRNDMGQDVGIHVTTANDGSYTFSPGELAAVSGSFQIFVDIIAEEKGNIDATGYCFGSFWRSRISCMLMLYAM